jgi:hypothetical protein
MSGSVDIKKVSITEWFPGTLPDGERKVRWSCHISILERPGSRSNLARSKLFPPTEFRSDGGLEWWIGRNGICMNDARTKPLV